MGIEPMTSLFDLECSTTELTEALLSNFLLQLTTMSPYGASHVLGFCMDDRFQEFLPRREIAYSHCCFQCDTIPNCCCLVNSWRGLQHSVNFHLKTTKIPVGIEPMTSLFDLEFSTTELTEVLLGNLLL